MYYIQVSDKVAKNVIMEITTESEHTKEAYINYYKHYGYDVQEQEVLNKKKEDKHEIKNKIV